MPESHRKRRRSPSTERARGERQSRRTDSRGNGGGAGGSRDERRSRSPRREAKVPAPLDDEQRQEAERVARIAQLAEERAAKRAAEKSKTEIAVASAAPNGGEESTPATQGKKVPLKIDGAGLSESSGAGVTDAVPKVVFRSKAQRQQDALARLEQRRQEVRAYCFLVGVDVILINYFVCV